METRQCPVCKARTSWVKVKGGYKCLQCSAIIPKTYYAALPMDLTREELQSELQKWREIAYSWKDLFKAKVIAGSAPSVVSIKSLDSLMVGRAEGLQNQIARMKAEHEQHVHNLTVEIERLKNGHK
jgi:hypothetical protein